MKTEAGQNGLLDFSFKPHAFRLRFLTKAALQNPINSSR